MSGQSYIVVYGCRFCPCTREVTDPRWCGCGHLRGDHRWHLYVPLPGLIAEQRRRARRHVRLARHWRSTTAPDRRSMAHRELYKAGRERRILLALTRMEGSYITEAEYLRLRAYDPRF